MTEQPDKLDLHSQDISEEKKRELLRLFPEIHTEGGKINFERLKTAMGEMVDVGKERYGMNWPGKADCFKTIQAPSMGTLRPCPEESVNFDTTENLIIEGDNLEVLKLLQKSYLGKIKMIYIDPPYNTGNDFIYPDNYTESLQTYLQYTGQVDSEGKKFSTNSETDGRFHSKWLNMMYPRLYLARNLLRDDGIVLINIDDNEVCNLRKFLDEIFGEENFVAQLTIENDSRARQYGSIATTHEYLLIYSKSQDYKHNTLTKENKNFQYADKDGGFDIYELRNRNIAFNIGNRPNLYYPFWVNPNSQDKDGFFQIGLEESEGWIKTFPQESQGVKTVWRWGKEKASKNLNTTLVARKHSGGFYQIVKKYRGNTFVYNSVWVDKEIKTDKGTLEIKALFDNKKVFDFPKPVELLNRALSIFSNEESIILDFFAGSGTTAHAIIELNKQDNGNRKFILVQLPEPCASDSEASKAGFKTISEITKERVRRVIKKLNEDDEKKSPRLFSEEKKKADRGFRVFKLAESNFKTWNADIAKGNVSALEKQLELHIDHIRPDRSQEDILYEILLKSGFALTPPIEKLELAGMTVFSAAGGTFLICLERKLTMGVIEAMAKRKPERVVCLDEGFTGNDQLKANAVQIFKTKGVNFKTV